MLVNRRTTSHLIRGDKPFVATREYIVSKLTPMNPIRKAVDAKSDEATLGGLAEGNGRFIGGVWGTAMDGGADGPRGFAREVGEAGGLTWAALNWHQRPR